MASRFLFGVALLLGISMDAHAQYAPYCVSSAYGSNCGYFDVATCQAVARDQQGTCVGNSQAEPTRAPTGGIDFTALIRGERAAFEDQRARVEAQQRDAEFALRMRIMEDQRRVAQAAADADAAAGTDSVTYPAPAVGMPSDAMAPSESPMQMTPPGGTASKLQYACTHLLLRGEKTLTIEAFAAAVHCAAIVRGVLTGHRLTVNQGGRPLFCVPNDAFSEIIRKIIVATPKDPEQDDGMFIVEQLSADFPCSAG